MIILSIDPGLVNVGVALYNSDTRAFISIRHIQLVAKQKDLKCTDDLIKILHNMFIKPSGAMHNMVRAADVVVIERQLKRNFVVFQYALASMMHMMDKKCVMCAPQSVKAYAKTSSGIKGRQNQKKAHAKNKQLAIIYAQKRWPKEFAKVTSKRKRDDMADAMIMAAWFAERSDSSQNIKPDKYDKKYKNTKMKR